VDAVTVEPVEAERGPAVAEMVPDRELQTQQAPAEPAAVVLAETAALHRLRHLPRHLNRASIFG